MIDVPRRLLWDYEVAPDDELWRLQRIRRRPHRLVQKHGSREQIGDADMPTSQRKPTID